MAFVEAWAYAYVEIGVFQEAFAYVYEGTAKASVDLTNSGNLSILANAVATAAGVDHRRRDRQCIHRDGRCRICLCIRLYRQWHRPTCRCLCDRRRTSKPPARGRHSSKIAHTPASANASVNLDNNGSLEIAAAAYAEAYYAKAYAKINDGIEQFA